jgi:hypothetical protein
MTTPKENSHEALVEACKAMLNAQAWVTIAHADKRYDVALRKVSVALALAEGEKKP